MKGYSLRSCLWEEYLKAADEAVPIRGFYNSACKDFDRIGSKVFIRHCYSFYLANRELFINKKISVINAVSPITILLGFYASIFSKVPPVIIPSRKSLGDHGALNSYLDTVLENIAPEDTLLLTDDYADFNLATGSLYRYIDYYVIAHKTVKDITGIVSIAGETELQPAISDNEELETAFFQFTSGSTANGKLIALSHQNVFTNTLNIYQGTFCNATDVGISWLPLYHDMGLVGAELFCLLNKVPFYLMSPFDFLRAPYLWFLLAEKYQCTLSISPNFGYEYCVKFMNDKQLGNCNLSSIRLLFNGAEPIDLKVLSRFYNRFSKYGLRKNVFLPCYGMAEATLAVSFINIREPINAVEIQIDQFSFGSKVNLVRHYGVDFEKIQQPSNNVVALPSLGVPVNGMEVAIIDEDEKVLGDGFVGEIVINGSSVAQGYLQKGNVQAFAGVHRTGDLGFTWNKEIYVIDRIKNTIIKNGRNISISYLEHKLADELGIGIYYIAVFERSIYDHQIIAFIESVQDMDQLTGDTGKVQELMRKYNIDKLYLTPNRIINRTTSGKKQYFKCRQFIDHETIHKNKHILILDAHGNS
jgi:acyl-CoA synthetase (AMP-forming)/AMP-acid ligase II